MDTKPRFVSALLVVAQNILDARDVYGFDKVFQATIAGNQSVRKYRANSGEYSRHVDFPVACVFALTLAFAVEPEFNPGVSTSLRFVVGVVAVVSAAQIAHQQTLRLYSKLTALPQRGRHKHPRQPAIDLLPDA